MQLILCKVYSDCKRVCCLIHLSLPTPVVQFSTPNHVVLGLILEPASLAPTFMYTYLHVHKLIFLEDMGGPWGWGELGE